ncbi:Uncharacterised protein [Shewanella baltica]|nr:Uncharacterised protein [Shewanella baltica]
MKYAETMQYYLLKTALQLRPYLKKINSYSIIYTN